MDLSENINLIFPSSNNKLFSICIASPSLCSSDSSQEKQFGHKTKINSSLTFPFCLSIASYIFQTGGSGSGPVAVTWAPISYKLKTEEKLSFILINQIEPTVVVFNILIVFHC